MVTVRYGGEGGETLELADDENYVVVRTHSQAPLLAETATPLELSAHRAARELAPVVAFRDAGVEVFKADDRDAARASLKQDPAVRFAGRGLHDRKSGEPVVYTENLFLQAAPGYGPHVVDELAGAYAGLRVRQLEYAPDAYYLRFPEGTGQDIFAIALQLVARDDVLLCHPELIRESAHKALSHQWHLGKTRYLDQDVDDSANVRDAWLHRTGAGITIAVIDDGIDVSHEEFAMPGKVVWPRDATRRLDRADPGPEDNHGTPCAGVACASGAFGASGVAPAAKLMPIRLVSNLGSQNEADAIVWAADHGADVISCSWGPRDARYDDPDDPLRDRRVPLPDSTRLAIDYAVEQGRQGRGCVIAWAAGNGNESVDNDGYASYDKVIAVGACNDRGQRSVYSDFGKALWCMFPSSDAKYGDRPASITPGIWTTDRPGNTGYNKGEEAKGGLDGLYTNDFGGTSSAAPGVAGVAALVLEENPALTWDQVKGIIKESCTQIDAANAGYGADGHSHEYGYGRVDALEAVFRARPPDAVVSTPVTLPPPLVRASMNFVVPYDPDFLGDGFRVPVPTPECTGRLVEGGRLFDFIHYSLVMHRDRRSALYVAHNTDVSLLRTVGDASWSIDRRVGADNQTPAAAYANNVWDKGHLAMRQAVAWGETEERARAAAVASYFYPNAALQHEDFNREEWVHLERWVLTAAGGVSPRLCVLVGPLYTEHDIHEGPWRVPSAFWKVVALRDPTADGDDVSVIGFMMQQNELWGEWAGADTVDLQIYQVGVAEIAAYTGLDFGDLALLDEFEWRQARFRDRSRMRPVPVEGPGDIEFFGDRRRERGIRALPRGLPPALREAKTADPDTVDPARAELESRVTTLAQQTEELRAAVEALLERQPEVEQDRDEVLRSRRAFERIVGGVTTGPGDFPHCACIGYGDAWFCSGVLVAPNVVLTAAHCAPEIDKVFLNGRFLSQPASTVEIVEVVQVVMHPDYDPHAAPSHDIAVLILARDAQTQPVAYATEEEVAAAGEVELVGFGYNHPSQPLGFGTQRRVKVSRTRMGGMTEAQRRLTETTFGFDGEFEFHAGRKFLGKDSCNGDSGGPAYICVGNDWKVAGITSRAAIGFESPCGDGGIYTRVAPYWPWIAAIAAGNVEAAAPASRTTERLYISAALPRPGGGGSEWIEVTNAGTGAVSLADYEIADAAMVRRNRSDALAGQLDGGATHRIALDDSAIVLANRGDTIHLYRNGVEVHQETYGRARVDEVFSFDAPAVAGGALPNADPC